MTKVIKLGTRGSELALWQAYHVKEKIVNSKTDCYVHVNVIKTSGDIDQKTSVMDLGGKNVFTKQIEEALLRKEIDIAVHSLKDMSAKPSDVFEITSYLTQGNRNDVFVNQKRLALEQMPNGSRIGVGGPRRQKLLNIFYPKVQFCSIRGNVTTRIEKCARGEYDGIILSQAGLERLNLADEISEALPTNQFVPAAGQGIIAVQCRAEDSETKALLKNIDQAEARVMADIEFSCQRILGVGCQEPVGIFAVLNGGSIAVHYFVSKNDSPHYLIGTYESTWERRHHLGEIMADELKALWKERFNEELIYT